MLVVDPWDLTQAMYDLSVVYASASVAFPFVLADRRSPGLACLDQGPRVGRGSSSPQPHPQPSAGTSEPRLAHRRLDRLHRHDRGVRSGRRLLLVADGCLGHVVVSLQPVDGVLRLQAVTHGLKALMRQQLDSLTILQSLPDLC